MSHPPMSIDLLLTYLASRCRVFFVAQSKRKAKRGGARPGAGRKRIFRDRKLRSVSFEREDLKKAQALADRRGIHLSLVIRDALRQYLKRQRS